MLSPALRYARANSGITFRPDANTVLWLPGQDDPQSSTIRDRSGNGNNGAITGAVWTQTGQGLWYLDFDKVDDVVDCGSDASIANLFDGGGTAIAWINPGSSGEAGNGEIFFKRSGATGWQWFTDDESGGKVVLAFWQRFSTTLGQWDTTTQEVDINTWTMAVVAYDNGNVANNPTFYIASGGTVSTLTVGSGLTEYSTPVGTRGADGAVSLQMGGTNVGSSTFDSGIALPILKNASSTLAQVTGIYQQTRHLFGV